MACQEELFYYGLCPDLNELAEELAKAINGQVRVIKEYKMAEQTCAMIVLDKYFKRSASSTSLSLFLVCTPQGTALSMTPAAGAVTLYRPTDYGTENDLTHQALEALKERGRMNLQGSIPENRLPNEQQAS